MEATREQRRLVIENLVDSPDEAGKRAQVAHLRSAHGLPLPVPDWESVDGRAMVLLCASGQEPVGSVRLAPYQRSGGSGDRRSYLVPDLEEQPPSDPAGCILLERLVVSPRSRSLEVLALLLHAAARWAPHHWTVEEYAAITRPQLVRLFGWLGARPLSEGVVLPGSDGPALPIGGRVGEAAARTGAMFAARGWRMAPITAPSEKPQPAIWSTGTHTSPGCGSTGCAGCVGATPGSHDLVVRT